MRLIHNRFTFHNYIIIELTAHCFIFLRKLGTGLKGDDILRRRWLK